MRVESSGHSQDNPRFFELIENAPRNESGKSPSVFAWPELVDFLKVAGQPVAGPWPPHQEPRPDPEEDSLPVAVAEPDDDDRPAPGGDRPTPGGARSAPGDQAGPPGQANPSTRPGRP
jgi:hypothetical protein